MSNTFKQRLSKINRSISIKSTNQYIKIKRSISKNRAFARIVESATHAKRNITTVQRHEAIKKRQLHSITALKMIQQNLFTA